MTTEAAVDNFDRLVPLVPEVFDGDAFYYTELLDRSKGSGNNKNRRVHVFTHRRRQDLLDQRHQIVDLCETTLARAYFRVTPRSFEAVGRRYVRDVIEQAMTNNWQGMRHGYWSAAGRAPGKPRRWIWDIDRREPHAVDAAIESHPAFLLSVPSRKGRHLITAPLDVREIGLVGGSPDFPDVALTLHRDNPTNLYIPADAA